ncbi:hypothetical protein LCGC14_0687560 [marine sediment metagenome]|uniref:Uncharacterized protein n=1 Tax=marine sediment metagenome TaxID=412755 RepID=A0A0F9QLE3_9ZZZZ
MKYLKYDEKGVAYDSYPTKILKELSKRKDDVGFTARKLLEFEKEGKRIRELIKKKKNKLDTPSGGLA